MRETDWIVGMPTLAMTGFEHHFDNPAIDISADGAYYRGAGETAAEQID
jgi:hypothetical protein